jgi:hypothetical protein
LELGLSKALGVVYRPTACMTTVPPVGATLTKGDAPAGRRRLTGIFGSRACFEH